MIPEAIQRLHKLYQHKQGESTWGQEKHSEGCGTVANRRDQSRGHHPTSRTKHRAQHYGLDVPLVPDENLGQIQEKVVETTRQRPISLLPVVSQVLERLIHKQLATYFHNHNLLCKSQSGFRRMH